MPNTRKAFDITHNDGNFRIAAMPILYKIEPPSCVREISAGSTNFNSKFGIDLKSAFRLKYVGA